MVEWNKELGVWESGIGLENGKSLMREKQTLDQKGTSKVFEVVIYYFVFSFPFFFTITRFENMHKKLTCVDKHNRSW